MYLHNRILSRLSLRVKILFVLFAGITITAIGSWIGYYSTLEKYRSSLQQQTAVTLSAYSAALSKNLGDCFKILRAQSIDAVFQDGITRPHGAEYPLWMSRIRKASGDVLDDRIIGIFYYGVDGTVCAVGNVSVDQKLLHNLLISLSSDNSIESWEPSGLSDKSLLIGKRIYSARSNTFMAPIGVLIYRINLQNILNDVLQFDVREIPSSLLCFTVDHDLVFSANESFSSEDINTISHLKPTSHGFQIVSLSNINYFTVTNTFMLGKQQCLLVSLLPYDKLIQSVRQTMFTAIGLICSTISLSVLITILMARSITSEVNSLLEKMKNFKDGLYKSSPPSTSLTNNELELLNISFDRMAIAYQKMIEESYINELLLTQAQLHNLEQQLDPHFLYNTLETISYFAKRNGDQHIPTITTALAELLQCSLRCHEDCMPLEWELKIVNDYLLIQQIRFSDILNVSIVSDPSLQQVLMPKMSIQPLVENAIRYTFEEEEICFIKINIFSESTDVLCVQVWDNGPPLDPTLLEQLREKKRTANGNGIGLVNIDTRTKLLYGNAYGISFRNEDGLACVELRIPQKQCH